MPYKHTATGTIHRPGQIVQGQQTHPRMSDAAWADLGCEPYTPPVDTQPVVTEAQALAAAHPELPGHVRAAFDSLVKLAGMGVAISLDPLSGWDEIGEAIADAKAAAPDFAAYRAIDSEGDRAEGHWKKITFHIGEDAAYRLAKELAETGVEP